MTWHRIVPLALTLVAVLGCSGLLDEDQRVCTLRSDKICAEHYEKRFAEDSLDSTIREQGRVLVNAACERGEAVACRVYGIEIGFPHEGFAPRVVDALVALESACSAGDVEGCFQVGYLSEQPGPNQDYARAAAVYTQLCDNNSSASCNNLGFLFEHGRGVQADPVKATEMYDRSCKLGHSLACSNYGLRLEYGRGIKQDPVAARALWSKQCEGGRAQDCYRWASSLARNEQDYEQATKLSERACTGGYTPACVTLGYDHERGRGRDKSLEKALEVWLKACDKSNGEACDAAAVAYDHGNGVEKDSERAMKLFERGCQLEYGGACYNLSILMPGDQPDLIERACLLDDSRACNHHAEHQLEVGNLNNARQAWARSCDLGDNDACKALGSNYETNKPIDYPKAFNAYVTACNRGMAVTCGLAGSMLTNKAEAKPWFQKGCDLGDRVSCRKR